MAIDIKNLLSLMVQKDISDIHFKADSVPALRVRGSMILATNLQKMNAEDIKNVAYQLMNKEQTAEFEKEMELDLAYSLDGVARFSTACFRANCTTRSSRVGREYRRRRRATAHPARMPNRERWASRSSKCPRRANPATTGFRCRPAIRSRPHCRPA